MSTPTNLDESAATHAADVVLFNDPVSSWHLRTAAILVGELGVSQTCDDLRARAETAIENVTRGAQGDGWELFVGDLARSALAQVDWLAILQRAALQVGVGDGWELLVGPLARSALAQVDWLAILQRAAAIDGGEL